MRIIVLAGGLSPERDVSLSSGALISNALIENGHDVMLLDLYLGINNKNIEPAYKNLKSKERFSYSFPEKEPDLLAIKETDGALSLTFNKDRATTNPSVYEMCLAWAKQAEKYKNGEITKDEYDKWRYNYPKYDDWQVWTKVPSQELSDALVEQFKDKIKDM